MGFRVGEVPESHPCVQRVGGQEEAHRLHCCTGLRSLEGALADRDPWLAYQPQDPKQDLDPVQYLDPLKMVPASPAVVGLSYPAVHLSPYKVTCHLCRCPG